MVGALFLIAMVTALVGGAALIDPNLTAADYLTSLVSTGGQVRLGALLELVNGVCVVGIGVLMFGILRRHCLKVAVGYVAFRVLEAVAIMVAVVSPLALVHLSQDVIPTSGLDASQFEAAGAALQVTRLVWTGSMIGIFFSLTGLILFYALFRYRLVPRILSIVGLVAVVLVFAWNLFEFMGIQVPAGIAFGLPIILVEVFLGFWLIVRGFEPAAVGD
jgi:hypothetical protein